jgi:hypothetical protein
LRRGLGQEEKRFIDVVVLMIILARVFEGLALGTPVISFPLPHAKFAPAELARTIK